jgi:Tfp pilus assembly protein PilE
VAVIEVIGLFFLTAIIAAAALYGLKAHARNEARAQIRASLSRAALAAERYAADQEGSYSGLDSLQGDALESFGYRQVGPVSIDVEDAREESYCIRGEHSDLTGDKWALATFSSSADAPSASDECR